VKASEYATISAARMFHKKIDKNLRFPLAICHASYAISLRSQSPFTMSDLLEEDELHSALKKCPEWEYEKKAIIRVVEFEEFNDAIDFVNGVAEIVEEAQHHPEINIRHTRVLLKLTTHDAGGVTDADIELAQRIDNLID